MDLDDEIRKYALKNAYQHNGKAEAGAVIGKILAEYPELRKDTKDVASKVSEIVREINSFSLDQIKTIIQDHYPEFIVKEKRIQEHRLPDLKNVHGKVVMRMAPSPSGPLHIGHSRMAILNDEYVKRYGGSLILRIEDTNPENIDPIAYDQIPKDLEWLDVNFDKIVIQSDRFDLYYAEARKLLKEEHAYICTCEQSDFKAKLLKSIACPHRNTNANENLELFDKILSGKFKKGEAVLVIKTDLNHPNPAIRDWIAFRIVQTSHPRVGKDFVFYPTMNFSVAVDDHLLGLTHVIRGKDHLNNTYRQLYIFNYNSWKIPEYYHYGLVKFPGFVLKTSIIKKGIKSGIYSGWDDIKLATIMTFKKRGFKPETFRRYWIESGMREIDSEFSIEIFNSMNKNIADYETPRLFFVPNPLKLHLSNMEEITTRIPNHPSNKSLGAREYTIPQNSDVYVPSFDWKTVGESSIVRLKDLCNVKKDNENAVYVGNDPIKNAKILQWSPEDGVPFEVLKPDGTRDLGIMEPHGKAFLGFYQLERYGYVNVVSPGIAYFTHS